MKVALLVLVLLAASAVALDVHGRTNLERNGLAAKLFGKAVVSGPGFSPMKTPTNKLPAAPSDKGKKSEAQDTKAPADAKVKGSAAAAKAAVAGKDLKHGTLNDLVTVVSQSLFTQLKNFKLGDKLNSWVDSAGGPIKTALANLVKGVKSVVDKVKNFFGVKFASTSSSSGPDANKICHWVVSMDTSFKKTDYVVTPMDHQDSYSSWHPGTCSVGSTVERMGTYNCLDGATQKSNPQTASTTANANFVCLDKDGTMVSPPGNCKAKIQFYAGYKGSTYSMSDSYLVCPIGSRHIQVSAAHEASLQVGTNVLASKGAVTSTGNSITETYSFTLTAGAGAGTGKDGPTSSANVGLSFGYTVQEIADFGEKSNVVAFQNQGAYDVPFNALITTVASSQINGAGRVWGSASSQTDSWLMCIVGTSTDCGMQNTGAYMGVGSGDQFKAYIDACNGVFKNNGA